MKRTTSYPINIFLALIVLTSLNSCLTSKNLAYFNNIARDSISQIQPQNLQTSINKNDILQINISVLDETTTHLLNAPTAVSTGGSSGSLNGYLVDESGIVQLPLLGSIKAEGLTKFDLASKIASELLKRKIAKEPIVNVRILNYKVTVLGEVTHPGVIPVPNEHITLPEALASAGDLTAFGKRDNVLLIRESNGQRIYKRFSLNQSQIFDPELYNLQNQDIIYVQPNAARAGSSDRATQLIPIAFSAVSLLLVIYLQLIK
ncbi:polysaccharide biosynthesis/export family protein [Mucilaginibacter segetis]|uniref:Polysaccharide biosynthesis/export family protein n=1 Tax=Mucilaginibacter segetis TaxID=2793071 RepID=A0A934PWW3_9SPHI|nr:polysaccharide biosynthesis/export family protein [Mucilaginibacter segetis]MBK0380645.1 polysaccharide biosynthesis/export family protein [Mucilaginibacter segetis]